MLKLTNINIDDQENIKNSDVFVFGPWKIELTKLKLDMDNKDDSVEKRIDIMDIAQGNMKYTLPFVDNDNENENAYFIDRSKDIRNIKAFRGLPKGIKNILPIVNVRIDKNTNMQHKAVEIKEKFVMCVHVTFEKVALS